MRRFRTYRVDMLTVIEKVIFLQNVEVFSEVATEQLAYLAAIAEEMEYANGESIYNVNDVSDALYLVVDGRVRLHLDERDIASAGPKEAFGTWALFDDEPRVTSATAEDDSRLLRIDREDFVDLLADHIQITQAVLKSVVSRLRSLVDRVGIERSAPEAP
ncbi:MAG: cyclic nucleotide-binding domain-containing protein [Candidatus Zixiibacteriota bacterium]|nr:MAG: cyclic nucleotide-binding domain-containing protein [candidate division Zixibacteria bacterium]